ncbi:hypothetical protein WN944_006326 [Citrus x changshan-huyou]|uniref:Uncharacterized protein n=1 Tax=Citrus x changshan-huyou TaxID=2935761 RepID=A0AAP0QX37_9ROSI
MLLKINKPYLPLASGDLSRGTAMAICIGSAILSFTLAIMSGSPPLLSIQILGFLSGCAYSLPLTFLRWKSHTFMAPLCLVIMMGLTALPFCMHMQQYVLGRPSVITRPLIFMVAIMSIFAFVNGLLKDLPDVEGDKKFGMNTLCVVLGKEKVLPLCVNMVLVGYGCALVAGASSSFMINKLVTERNLALPPQGRPGHRVNAKLVSKEKEKIFAQWFGKDICSLLQRGNMRGFKETLRYFFTNKMDVNFDMLAARMKHGVASHVDGARVIAKKVRNV